MRKPKADNIIISLNMYRYIDTAYLDKQNIAYSCKETHYSCL